MELFDQEPRPIRADEAPDVETVHLVRRLDCRRTYACLRVAVHENWPAMRCDDACTAYQRSTFEETLEDAGLCAELIGAAEREAVRFEAEETRKAARKLPARKSDDSDGNNVDVDSNHIQRV